MNKNIYKHRMGWLALLLMTVLSFAATSCSDDEEGYGTPEITGVRVTDPAKADSLFTKAGTGQIIVIIGKNLSDVRNVYINDQNVTFNSTMNTSHSLIVTIPTEEDGFELTTFNKDLNDEIRVETSHGTAVYQFKITAPYPQLQRIAGEYPRQNGDVITIYGRNLVDIEQIYFTDVAAEDLDANTSETIPGNHTDLSGSYTITKEDHHLDASTNSYVTDVEMQITIPDNAPQSGSLVIETAAGTVYYPFYRVPGQPVITSISNDMPEIGETLVITGREFVQVEAITYGDITLSEDEYTVADTEDRIEIEFKRKPTSGSTPKLTVVTPGGEVSVDRFYDHSTILTTFDGDATDNGWGPNATYPDAGNADGVYAHINVEREAQQWWGTMIYFRKDWNGNSFPLSSNIPATASADEVYLAMNVYDNNSSFNNGTYFGEIRYMIDPIGNGADVESSNFYYDMVVNEEFPDGPVLQDINGVNHKQTWYRAVVPLSKFACYTGMTYSQIVSTGLYQFRLMSYNASTTVGKIDVKFDNIRVIYIPKSN